MLEGFEAAATPAWLKFTPRASMATPPQTRATVRPLGDLTAAAANKKEEEATPDWCLGLRSNRLAATPDRTDMQPAL